MGSYRKMLDILQKSVHEVYIWQPNNTNMVIPYLYAHKAIVKTNNPR